jgi:hypothetical protein
MRQRAATTHGEARTERQSDLSLCFAGPGLRKVDHTRQCGTAGTAANDFEGKRCGLVYRLYGDGVVVVTSALEADRVFDRTVIGLAPDS